MRFVDSALITIEAGNGGKGIISFRREKNISRGGPDGGNGGKGGDIFLLGNQKLHSLLDYHYTSSYKAGDGKSGGSRNKHGANGADMLLPVPRGTLAYDATGDELIGEILKDGEKLAVAYGGRGGLGNNHFKSSVRRAPTKSTSGTPGENRKLRLELRLLADIGIVGLPNAGKSSFLAAATHAKPKIANYPFTTLNPLCGVFSESVQDTGLVLADIPGIIEGAAQGKGLGLNFLRHIRRARLLFHLADMSGDDPTANVRVFEDELASFDAELLQMPRWILGTKADLLNTASRKEKRRELEKIGLPVHIVSSLRDEGVREVCLRAQRHLDL